MGQIFAGFFKSLNLTCLVSDIGTQLSNEKLVAQCNVIIFSLPISKTVTVIESLLPYISPEQMLVDFTSLKTAPIQAMLKSKAEVLGMHPMFGPGTESLKGQTIIYCASRKGKQTDSFLELFKKAGLKLKASTPEKHDRMMSLIQALNHTNALVMAKVISEFGEELKESLEYSGPVYLMRFDLIARMLSQSPELYADLALENPFGREVFDKWQESARLISEIIANGDKQGFIDYFSQAAKSFSPILNSGLERSNKIIKYLTELEEE